MIKNKESDFDIKGFKNIKVSYKNDLEKVWAHSVLKKVKLIIYKRKQKRL
jgi:hypothetical protein